MYRAQIYLIEYARGYFGRVARDREPIEPEHVDRSGGRYPSWDRSNHEVGLIALVRITRLPHVRMTAATRGVDETRSDQGQIHLLAPPLQ